MPSAGAVFGMAMSMSVAAITTFLTVSTVIAVPSMVVLMSVTITVSAAAHTPATISASVGIWRSVPRTYQKNYAILPRKAKKNLYFHGCHTCTVLQNMYQATAKHNHQ